MSLRPAGVSRELAAGVVRGIASGEGCAPSAASIAASLVGAPGELRDAAEELCNAIIYKSAAAASTDAAVLEGTKRMRADADTGGERCMDQSNRAGVSIHAVVGTTAGTVPWSRAAHVRGAAEWIVPDSLWKESATSAASNQTAAPRRSNARILFLHGGSYEWYSPSDVYRPFTTRLAEATGMPVLAIDYRLAPEHCFPAAVEDAVAGLEYMAGHQPDVLGPPETPADCLLVCGDSAGGGLALALLEAVRTNAAGSSSSGLDVDVAGCATVSAWTDLSCTVDTYRTRVWDEEKYTGDPIFSTGNPAADSASGGKGALRYAGLAEGMLQHPLVSPLHTPNEGLAQLPKLLMVVGDAEVMLGDTTEYAARAVAAGAPDVTLRVFPSMWHCWPMYSEGCGQFPDEAEQMLGNNPSPGDATAVARKGFAPAVDALIEIGSFLRSVAADKQLGNV